MAASGEWDSRSGLSNVSDCFYKQCKCLQHIYLLSGCGSLDFRSGFLDFAISLCKRTQRRKACKRALVLAKGTFRAECWIMEVGEIQSGVC